MNKFWIIVLILILGAGIYSYSKNTSSPKSQPNEPQVTKSASPTGSPQYIVPPSSHTTLEECLRQAANLDAPDWVIKQAQEECHKQYGR